MWRLLVYLACFVLLTKFSHHWYWGAGWRGIGAGYGVVCVRVGGGGESSSISFPHLPVKTPASQIGLTPLAGPGLRSRWPLLMTGS